MSFGAVAAPLILEGDYSEWTEVEDSPLDMPDLIRVQDGYVNESEKKAFLIHGGLSYYAIVTLEPPAIDEEELVATNRWGTGTANYNPSHASILGKYFVNVKDDETGVNIYKDGVLTQTITLTADGGVIIGPSGLYLLVLDATNEQLHIYKGA